MTWFKSRAEEYYKMNDAELEKEAARWKIGGYGNRGGMSINRQIIIDALLKKDEANHGKQALIVSALALIVSVFALLK